MTREEQTDESTEEARRQNENLRYVLTKTKLRILAASTFTFFSGLFIDTARSDWRIQEYRNFLIDSGIGLGCLVVGLGVGYSAVSYLRNNLQR